MPEAGYYSPTTAKLVFDVVQYLRANGFVIAGGQKRPYNAPPNTPVYIQNVSGETIPPFACIQATGTEEVGSQNYLKADKPADSTGNAGPFFFNLFREIEPDEFGIADEGPEVRAIGPSVAAGTDLQPQSGSWSLEEGSGGFKAIGSDDIGEGIIRVKATVGGGGGQYGLIAIEGGSGSGSGSGSGGSGGSGDNCFSGQIGSIDGEVIRRPCGVSKLIGETDAGLLEGIEDPMGWLEGRNLGDIAGKIARVEYYAAEEGSGSGSGSGSQPGECSWVITGVNLFTETESIRKIYWDGSAIVGDKEKIKVWDVCEIDPDTIPFVDCETDSGGGSGGSGGGSV